MILPGLDHAEFTKCPIFIENLASARKKWPIHKGFYVGDLVQKTEQDLSRTPNFGRRSMAEIKMVLASMNLQLGMDVQGWPPFNPVVLKNVDDVKA